MGSNLFKANLKSELCGTIFISYMWEGALEGGGGHPEYRL